MLSLNLGTFTPYLQNGPSPTKRTSKFEFYNPILTKITWSHKLPRLVVLPPLQLPDYWGFPLSQCFALRYVHFLAPRIHRFYTISIITSLATKITFMTTNTTMESVHKFDVTLDQT